MLVTIPAPVSSRPKPKEREKRKIARAAGDRRRSRRATRVNRPARDHRARVAGSVVTCAQDNDRASLRGPRGAR